MPVTYDPWLILLSIVIAVFGAYTSFHLARQVPAAAGIARKGLLAGAAAMMGGGIWSMHFVGMLAVRLPITVDYDVLLTLISALVSILMTGLALSLASFGRRAAASLAGGGALMGGGVAAMHYIGMSAIRAACIVTYDWRLVVLSVAIAVATSTCALWLAFSVSGTAKRMAGAAVMGLAISGMHYTAMLAATFVPWDALEARAAPELTQPLLAVVIAVAAFVIFSLTLLTALPDRSPAPLPAPLQAPPQAPPPAPIAAAEPSAWLVKLPVEKNKATLFIDPTDVLAVHAEAHYTTVITRDGRYFCPLSMAELERRLDPARFVRVHRSHLVNIHYARALERQNDQPVIVLEGLTGEPVPVSRGRVPKLRAALGF